MFSILNIQSAAMEDFSEKHNDRSSTNNSRRLDVYDVSGSTRRIIARLKVSAEPHGKFDVAISSESTESSTRIRELIERKVEKGIQPPSPDLSDEETLKRGVAKLREILTKHGYETTELPAADHALSCVIDMRTGAMVGTNAALHDAVASNSDDIARRIADSLSKAFSTPLNELAAKISAAIAAGSPPTALELISQAYESGSSAFPPTKGLLDSLLSVDLTTATNEQRKIVLEWRITAAHALEELAVAASAAEELLSGWRNTLTTGLISELRMIVAVAAMKQGNRESALLIWRELLEDPESLGAGNRGWAWRNISYALPANDPEALQTAQ